MIHYLDQGDIARMLGVEPQTVRAWHVRGKLPAPDCRVGDKRGWLRETIEQWAASR